MKRCKAVTSRACDAIECCLLADHDGAHEGQRDSWTRAIWTNPNAPEYLCLEDGPLAGSREAFERAQAASVRLLEDVAPVRTPQTHCACGAEHGDEDPSLRTVGGLPLVAMNSDTRELDERFRWPQICRDCGAVYCPVIKTL